MYDFKNADRIIKSRMSEYRYIHSVNVAKRAEEMAKIYGVNQEKAKFAGLIHDATKETDYEIQEELMKEAGIIPTDLEKNNKKVYHQMSGMAYAKLMLGVDDKDVLNGIRYHTTGRENMSDFEMIIYLADLTSAERNYKDVQYTRNLADKSLIKAMIYATDFVINDLKSKNLEVHPDTIKCNIWAKEKDNI